MEGEKEINPETRRRQAARGFDPAPRKKGRRQGVGGCGWLGERTSGDCAAGVGTLAGMPWQPASARNAAARINEREARRDFMAMKRVDGRLGVRFREVKCWIISVKAHPGPQSGCDTSSHFR